MDEVEPGVTCSVRLRHEYEFYFTMWKFWDRGFLPKPGTWTQQAYIFVQAFEIIEREVARVREQEIAGMRERHKGE